MTDKRPIYIFVHHSKTGGTSIYRHLKQHLVSEDELVYLGPEGDIERDRLGRPPLDERPERERRRIRVLIGHRIRLSTLDLVPWRQPRLIFFIRDPVDRMISKYNYQMHLRGLEDDPLRFEDWRANLKPNAWDTAFWLCRRFLEMPAGEIRDVEKRQQIAGQLLSQFYLVSITERLDRDAALIFKELGLPLDIKRENVGGRDHKSILRKTPGIEETIRREFSSEIRFYERWAGLAPYFGRAGRPVIASK